jgi:hypothetical protein
LTLTGSFASWDITTFYVSTVRKANRDYQNCFELQLREVIILGLFPGYEVRSLHGD